MLYQKHLGLSILPNTLWYSGNRVFLPHPIFCVTVLILNTNTVSYFSCFEKLFPRSMKWNLFSENHYKTLTNLKYVYLNFMTICLLLKLWKQRLVSYNEMSHFPVIKHETSSSKIVRKIIIAVTFFTSAQRFRHLRCLKIRTELSSAFRECSQSGKWNWKCEAYNDHLHLGNGLHFSGKVYIFLYTYHLLIYGQTST